MYLLVFSVQLPSLLVCPDTSLNLCANSSSIKQKSKEIYSLEL